MSYPHFAVDCGDHHDLVRDFDGPRPTVTVLCGSTRFGDAFRAANLRLTLAGHIVLTIGCDTKSDDDLVLAGGMSEDLKARLDVLHLRKIDLADEIYVVNVPTPDCPDGYIGESTRGEIEYAHGLGKPVRYLTDGFDAPDDTRDEPGSHGQSPPAGDGWMPPIHVVDSIPDGIVYAVSTVPDPGDGQRIYGAAKIEGAT